MYSFNKWLNTNIVFYLFYKKYFFVHCCNINVFFKSGFSKICSLFKNLYIAKSKSQLSLCSFFTIILFFNVSYNSFSNAKYKSLQSIWIVKLCFLIFK